jgi:hypothetical protein
MSIFQRYVDAFAKLMVEKLEKNAHKGEWENISNEYLFEMLNVELVELHEAVYHRENHSVDQVLREAADVANFALMIASNALRSQGIDLIEEDVWTYHGQWTVVDQILGLMYSNQRGQIAYEDNSNSRARGLPLLPPGAKFSAPGA